MALGQALDAAQATLEERSGEYEAQLAELQETVRQAEEAINTSDSALGAAQVCMLLFGGKRMVLERWGASREL